MAGERLRVLAVSGSYRDGSFNRALLRAAEDHAPEGVELAQFDLRRLPYFDADLEAAGDPDVVIEWKEAVSDADALLIATPEYNGSVPAVLKNGIDWASRGHPNSALSDKPAAVVSASPGRGGALRGADHVRTVLERVGAIVLRDPVLHVSRAHEHVADGRVERSETRAAMAEVVAILVDCVHMGEHGSRSVVLRSFGS